MAWHYSFEKYWRNSEIDTWTDPEDIWHWWWNYTWFPTWAAETLEIFSSDVADNWVTPWTWALTVQITNLLDWTWAAMPDITVTLNWTTPVSLWAQTYYRCTRAIVLTAWSSWSNTWTLTLRHTTTTANIFSVMPALMNQTATAAFTVPLWQTLYVKRINMQMARLSWAAWSAAMTFRARPNWQVFNAVLSPEITQGSSYTFENNWYQIFTARTDIKVRCEKVSDNNTVITADFSGFLIDD